MDKKSLLEWHADAGADEAIDDQTVNWFSAPPPPTVSETMTKAKAKPAEKKIDRNSLPLTSLAPPEPIQAPSVSNAKARVLADQCHTLDELRKAVMNFDDCALKKTATNTVFSDGNPKAEVMLIGEAPGAQEDEKGIPFCGPSGQLLDKVLGSIGLTREKNVYISNTIFWRPPGNRQPSEEETGMCLPFVEKHIALIAPKLLILCGGTACTTVLQQDQSISRLRGKTYEYTNPYLSAPIQTVVIYHPSYLMRSPGQKKLAWQDMLLVQKLLG